MPRANLKTAAQQRAASKVATRVAKGSKSKTTSTGDSSPVVALPTPSSVTPTSTTSRPITTASKPITTATNGAVVVPGLSAITPEQVSGMLPQFNEAQYQISDPLAPSENLPQVTETQFNKSEAVYQGTIRALKLTGMAFDVADQKFTVIGKRAKAFGSGVKAATAVERVKGDYLDYQSQLETTAQKSVTLDTAQSQTVNDRAVSVHSQSQMDERLKQAESDAEMARQKTAEKQNKLAEFKKSLGEYLVTR